MAQQIAHELAHGPTWAIRWTKRIGEPDHQGACLRHAEASMALEQVTFELADHREATMRSRKRKPRFGQAA